MAEPSLPAASADDLEPPPPTAGEKLRAVLATPARLLGILFVPDRAVPEVVVSRRYGAPFLVVVACALVSALVIGARLDVSGPILREIDQRRPPPGVRAPAEEEGNDLSDREIEERIAKERSVRRVTLGLGAGLGLPFRLLLLGVGLLFLGRYVGGRPDFLGSFTAACAAALPLSVKSLVAAAASTRRAVLTPEDLPGLVAPGDLVTATPHTLARFLAGVDLFFLWSVLLLVLGFAAAAQVSRARAAVAVGVGTVLYLFLSRMGGA